MGFKAVSDAAYVALRPSEERLPLSFSLVQADPTRLVLMVLRLVFGAGSTVGIALAHAGQAAEGRDRSLRSKEKGEGL